MRTNYPSDISCKQFEQIRERLDQSKKKTKPRVVDLYKVFCAILYVLTSGCQWRMLPKDYPKWQVVYKYFRQWSTKSSEEEISLLEQALKKCSRSNPYQVWTKRENVLYHFRCAEREEHGYSREKGLRCS